MKSGKIRVAVLYGGRSGEHEVSLQSAASVIRNLDPSRFEVVPVGIDKEGRWHLNDIKLITQGTGPGKSLPIFKDAPVVVLPASGGAAGGTLVPVDAKAGPLAAARIDVVFPVMHGTLCEDGSIQGLLELADLPYVGSGVLGSAIGMDKDVAKRLAKEAGLPIVPYVCLKRQAWEQDSAGALKKIAAELPLPVFVKPANAGSSVGVHKAKTQADLKAAIEDAFRFDTKVLVERGVKAREIELSALEDPRGEQGVLISIAGEIVPTHEFYSYEAKYLDEKGANLIIPAKLDKDLMKKCQDLARKIFLVLECEGMARIDLFLDKDSGELFMNEVNTIPGFTTISMYPKLFEATGIGYQELLSRLIDQAVRRHELKRALNRERK